VSKKEETMGFIIRLQITDYKMAPKGNFNNNSSATTTQTCAMRTRKGWSVPTASMNAPTDYGNQDKNARSEPILHDKAYKSKKEGPSPKHAYQQF
jgi:hypothetical protein